MAKKKNAVAEKLKSSGKTFEERGEQYGNAYTRVGKILKGYFPDGIALYEEEDFGRFYALMMVVNKLNRYASNMDSGGHEDSAHDATVYSAILESFTEEK